MKVEIISATECRIAEPRILDYALNERYLYYKDYSDWEINRKVYKIENIGEHLYRDGTIDLFYPFAPYNKNVAMNSRHEAEINEETKTAIII